jgi:hypothetical protein
MVKYKEYLAYEGDEFKIEWYFDEEGRSQALEYYHKLSSNEKVGVLKLFKRIGDIGKIQDTTKFRNEGEQIYAFKPKPDRFLCFFFRDSKIIVTNAFRKKQDKLPKNEQERAVKCKKDYETRIKGGIYYEQK